MRTIQSVGVGDVAEGTAVWEHVLEPRPFPIEGRIVALGTDFVVVREFYSTPVLTQLDKLTKIRPFDPAKDKDAQRPWGRDPRFLDYLIGATFCRFDALGRKFEGKIEAQDEDFFVVRDAATGKPVLVTRYDLAGSSLLAADEPDASSVAHREALLAAIDERERAIQARDGAAVEEGGEEIEAQAIYDELLAIEHLNTPAPIQARPDEHPEPPAKHDHPAHYGGKDNPYEAIKVIEAWGATFCGGNALKYIARAGKKSGESVLDDLKKAKWYLARAAASPPGARRADLAHAPPPGAPSYDSDDVAKAWGLPEALARCIAAIAVGQSMTALNHLNDHIINLLEQKA